MRKSTWGSTITFFRLVVIVVIVVGVVIVVVGVVIVVGVVVIQVNNWSSFERNRAKRSLEGPAGEVFREEADDGDGDVVERRQVGGQRRRRPADREVEHARRERKGVGL